MIDDFAADGQLAKAIPGFKPREPQRQMAKAVSEAIEASRPLVVEAGTGTGKTYAYLAPALRACVARCCVQAPASPKMR